MENLNLIFYGATETVTGSKTLLEINGSKILIDSGMYQGDRDSDFKNRKPLEFNPHEIDSIFLTHAHYDHSGYLPVVVKNGFKGHIYCTDATKKIVEIILKDSANIQAYDFKAGKVKEVLYDIEDVEKAMTQFKVVESGKWHEQNSFKYYLEEDGHILGATSITFDNNKYKICFSGDVGRMDDKIHRAPVKEVEADYLVLESTYGDRLHKQEDTLLELKKHVERIKQTQGVLLIPAFAVARSQIVIYELFELFEKYPDLEIPVYFDTPMGIKVTKLYMDMSEQLKIEPKRFVEAMKSIRFVEYSSDSKKLARAKKPFILISSSGMISGGRILQYMDMYAKHENNTVLITGYQGEGTIGRQLVNDERSISLFGHTMNVRAHVEKLESLSAHADRDELLEYIRKCGKNLKTVYVNHGEEETVEKFVETIRSELKIDAINVEDHKKYNLGN